MGLLRRLRAPSLLTRFGVISLVLTLAVGYVLSSVLSTAVTERAREQAEWTVLVAVRLGLQPQLTPRDLEQGFDPRRLAPVADAVRGAADDLQAGGRELDDLDPVELKIFDRDGDIVWSDDPDRIGETTDSAEFRAALAGQVVSGFSHSTTDSDDSEIGDRRLLEVYVPLQFEDRDAPSGVVELYLPYAPVAEAVESDLATLTWTLAVGLSVFYAALFRIVAGASRRLRRQTDELRRSADRDRHQATHDVLTGLPNRELLLERTGRALEQAARGPGGVALVLVDLDRFKEVNDTLGHGYGDALLRQVGPRIRSALRDGDTVARLGGDEFAVLLPAVEGVAEARGVGERLREALHRSFDVDGVALDVEASVGIAVSPWHGGVAEHLLRNADVAMYTAKELKGEAVVFDAGEHASAPNRLSLLGDLRRALDRDDELVLHYQPKITLAGERIEGVEALLRWQHPARGLVLPGDFVPVAEGTGLIVRLTERVLRLALAQSRSWLDAGHAVPVAVNLSTRCLLDADLPDRVQRLLSEQGVPAGLLRLEVTESAVMGDARCLEVLQRLHDLGVRLSIDDFGTGYSSMAYLRRMPVDELKIDRSFVLGMCTAPQDTVLVRSAIDLGHNLGLTVVAEGVEGADQVAALRALGCDVAQGYHYARPMPADRLSALLDAAGTTLAPSAAR
jgi:diguanylate cyclase (GGDEF)-like protein